MRLISKWTFFLALSSSLPLMASVDVMVTLPAKKIFAGLRCSQAIQAQLKDWGAINDWTKHASDAGSDGVILRSPTKEFATWIGVDAVSNEATVELLKPLAAKKVTFNSKCKPQTEIIMPKPDFSFEGKYTDLELASFINKNKKGIIYTWSANMPWSVDGIKEIRKAAAELGVPVQIVMGPDSDLNLTKKLLSEKKVTGDDTKPFASLELIMRGAAVHYPSIVWFKDGKVSRWARPGYEVSSLYVSYFSKEFK